MAKILIVDDSSAQLYSMSKLMKGQGYEVVVAENGEAAITMAKAELPDLILMDVVMPGISGFQATRQLSRDTQTKDIPIIFVTSKNQETDRIWGMRQGGADYITKPVNEKELLNAVKNTLAVA
ncbi:MAG: response regulator [Gammaproteobacteria bacterium]|jgi:twitching motility two-component system response regulator PilH|nr:response regulator [Gammaproteobacteria bacterium]